MNVNHIFTASIKNKKHINENYYNPNEILENYKIATESNIALYIKHEY